MLVRHIRRTIPRQQCYSRHNTRPRLPATTAPMLAALSSRPAATRRLLGADAPGRSRRLPRGRRGVGGRRTDGL